MTRVATTRLLAVLAVLLPVKAQAEVCRFEGTTSQAGRAAVRTEVGEAGGTLTVAVRVALHAVAWGFEVQYFSEEISAWRDGALQSVAVNNRSVVDGSVKRQQWDVFRRGPGGLEAWRVQAKRLADFQHLHPGFAGHWPLASFGQPWLAEYDAARPERRPDLDLKAPPQDLRPPLAFAFYWSRFLPPGGARVSLFLPGFKRDARAELAVAPAVPGEGWRRWQAPLRHPGLDRDPPSLAAVWVSPDAYLLQLGVELHAPQGMGQGVLRTLGCQGIQIAPPASGRG